MKDMSKYVSSEEMNDYAEAQVKKGYEVYISRVDKTKAKILKGYEIATVEGFKILSKDEPADMVLLRRKKK